jgi:uncharacterized protein (DUF2147 family)
MASDLRLIDLRAYCSGLTILARKRSIPILVVTAIALVTALSTRAAEPSGAGLWEQSDSKGDVGGWFLIFEHDGVYNGALVKMFRKPGENPNPICRKCRGDQKNQPWLGLVMIKGMQRKGRSYENGSILDPRNGSVYRVAMEVSPDGQKLKVRGYLGIELFGMSQVWRRLPSDALPQAQIPANLLPYLGQEFTAPAN